VGAVVLGYAGQTHPAFHTSVAYGDSSPQGEPFFQHLAKNGKSCYNHSVINDY
jgi:hypothetical protein